MRDFVKNVIVALAEGKAEFVVVGGISAVLRGAPITTIDLDICYRRTPDNVVRVARALAPMHPRLRGLPPDLPAVFDERTLLFGTNFTLEIGDESLDLLAEMSVIGGYEQILGQSSDLDVAGHQVKVLSLEQLIATKRGAGRPKDLAVLPILEDTLQRSRQTERPANDSGS